MSHTATGEWKSFEIKMRRRRAERLVLRADVAAETGCRTEAHALLEEARTLWPAAPGLAEVQQKIDAAEIAAAAPVDIAAPSRWKEITAAVTTLLFVGSTAYVVVRAERHATVRPAATPGVDAPTAVKDPAPFGTSAADVGASAETATAPETTPAAVAPGPGDAPSSGDPAPADATARVTGTSLRSISAPQANVSRATEPARGAAQPQAPPRKPAPTPIEALSRPALPPSDAIRLDAGTPEFTARMPVSIPVAPAPAPPPSLTTTPSPVIPVSSTTAPIQPPQEALVRGTLARYAKAYDDLDVDAARRVWPSVSRSALSRAFDSLASQHVSLGDCRIQVDAEGTGAHAACLGSTTWTPKVGGRAQTDRRSWNFDLEKSTAGWQIVNARVQNR